MGALHRRLAVGLLAGCVGCSLVTSLDYLEADRNGALVPGDGAPGSGPSSTGTFDAGICPPDQWSTCGVVTFVGDVTTTAIAASGDQASVYYADDHGSLQLAKCDTSCALTSTVLTGEDPVLFLGYNAVSLYWLTATSVRRIPLYADAAAVVTTATVRNPHGLATLYPNVAWSDDDGVRMEGVLGGTSVQTITNIAATSLLFTNKELLFLGAGPVLRCSTDQLPGGCGNLGPLVGIDSATTLSYAVGFSDLAPFFVNGGVVATVPRAGGTSFILAEQPDDAGVLPSIVDTLDTVVAVTGLAGDVYFTTSGGELRRRSKNQPNVITMLSGLGRRTYLAANEGGVFVSNPEARQLLHVAR